MLKGPRRKKKQKNRKTGVSKRFRTTHALSHHEKGSNGTPIKVGRTTNGRGLSTENNPNSSQKEGVRKGEESALQGLIPNNLGLLFEKETGERTKTVKGKGPMKPKI